MTDASQAIPYESSMLKQPLSEGRSRSGAADHGDARGDRIGAGKDTCAAPKPCKAARQSPDHRTIGPTSPTRKLVIPSRSRSITNFSARLSGRADHDVRRLGHLLLS